MLGGEAQTTFINGRVLMCIHDEDDLKWAIDSVKNSEINAIIFFRGEHGRVFGTMCQFRRSEDVMQAIRDLKYWHPELADMKADLSDVNKKRIANGLKPLQQRRPRTYTPVEGFESNGMSFPELMQELNSYAKRRAAA